MSQTEYIVTVLRGVRPQQIEDFPEGCARSVKGALHVSPGTMELTEDELKHIRKHHKDVARRFHVVTTVGSKAAAPKPKAAPAPAEPIKPEPTPGPTAPKVREDSPKKGKSK